MPSYGRWLYPLINILRLGMSNFLSRQDEVPMLTRGFGGNYLLCGDFHCTNFAANSGVVTTGSIPIALARGGSRLYRINRASKSRSKNRGAVKGYRTD